MKAAVVESFERTPKYGEFREPEAGAEEVVVRVAAAALSNLVRGQASGRHYSAGGELPFVPGNDGVGRLEDGTRVYFAGPERPFGTMAERSLVDLERTIALPDAIDDVTAAALGNPGLASWAALLERAQMQGGETVLVQGATGSAGQQAVQAARFLGAKRVVATGRDAAALERLRGLGADETILLSQSEDELKRAFQRVMRVEGVDLVLDYLWGRPAEILLDAMKGLGRSASERRVKYLQIGSIAGQTVNFPAEVLRSTGLEMMGSGLGSLSAEQIVRGLRRMFASYAEARLQIETEAVPLREVESRWSEKSEKRLVFTV